MAFGRDPGSRYDHETNLSYHFRWHGKRDVETESLPCIGKCMFQTGNGLNGLCPSGAAVNDVVVILYGGLVPYLLRPTKECGIWLFVGECYVDGYVHGEAFKQDRGEFWKPSV